MEIQLYAHRGGMGRAPENTLTSFKQALSDGADGFEIDVCLTKDKQPVLIHVDFNRDNISEATGCPIPLNQLTWKEVQQLKSKNSQENVAHLDEALIFARENQMPCFVEPKSDKPEILNIIIDRINHFEVVHLVSILTFCLRKQILIDVKHIEPKLKTSAITINPFSNYLKIATSIDVDRIIFGWNKINHFNIYNFFTRSILSQVDQLKANGILVEAGFILKLHDVVWAVKNGIHALWVDDIPYIKNCIEKVRDRYEF